MADVPPQAPPSVQSLLDALDARSRSQAEDAAGRLLGHSLDRVGEALASIEQRLGALESRNDGAAVFTQVVELGARLERFEQAFYRAVSEGGDGSDVVRNIETVVRQGTADYVRALEALRERQQGELSSLRAVVDELAQREPAPVQPAVELPPPVDLAPLIVRLDEVSAKIQRPSTDTMRELAERMEAQLDRLHESFPRLNELRQSLAEEMRPLSERVGAVEAAVTRAADVPGDLPAVASRLEAVTDQLLALEGQFEERDASLAQLDGRMDGLESRVRAHLAGLTERLEAIMGAVTDTSGVRERDERVTAVAGVLERLDSSVGSLREAVERSEQQRGAERSAIEQLQQDVRHHGETIAGLPDTFPAADALAAEVARSMPTADEVAAHVVKALPPFPELPAAVAPPSAEELAAKVRDVLHREFELLTQRVASLSVSLEATRTLLDQHVEDTAQSLGRRATEAGRKLAADLGFRPRKDDRRDPRELGRGGH